MGIDFRKIAAKTLSLSELMANREQLKTEDLIGQEVTMIAFDFATITDKGEEKTFPVILFSEYPERYYNGGTLLMKLCVAFTEECGDVLTASSALEDSGGVKLRFRNTKTKSGNNLTSIDVI